MTLATMDDVGFDFTRYVNDDDLDLGTPSPPAYGSPEPLRTDQSQPRTIVPGLPLLQLGEWDPNRSYSESPPACVHYTIEWKLLLNKGRVTRLTNDTEKNLVLAPGAFWDRTLKSKVEDLLKKKTPRDKSYKPEETNITVSITERSERDFSKRFDGLDINWDIIEEQLKDWSHLYRAGKKLRIDISFVCKEEVQATMLTRSGARRGATGIQLAERESILEGQQAVGQPSVWAAVYTLLRCPGHPCKNQGSYCWRDPDSKKHFALDTSVLTRLVRFAEEGNSLDTHKDVPESIRELIYAKEHQSQDRRQKRKASCEHFDDSRPIKIINVLPSPYGRSSPDYLTSAKGSSTSAAARRPVTLSIPEPRDQAILTYCQWHCRRVTGSEWKKGFQRAYTVAIEEFLDLAHIHEDQDVEFFVDKGVAKGIARSFVGDIEKWVKEVNTL